jgi:hypothetical protein
MLEHELEIKAILEKLNHVSSDEDTKMPRGKLEQEERQTIAIIMTKAEAKKEREKSER